MCQKSHVKNRRDKEKYSHSVFCKIPAKRHGVEENIKSKVRVNSCYSWQKSVMTVKWVKILEK